MNSQPGSTQNPSPGPNESDVRQRRLMVERLSAPSLTLAVGETVQWWVTRARYFNNDGTIPHGGGMNTLYFDGSVRRMSFAEIPQDANDIFWRGEE